VRCGRCGEENPERARFCLACGEPLTGESKQERKVVSVLFADLVGFTGRSHDGDPEDVRDTLHAYHGAAKEAIESFGGNLEKFIGDAVMAVFGAPISHGDDAERAVRAGLKVLAAVEDLGLRARAAVNTGEAVVAVGAAASSGQALAMGDVVNTASRLQSSAPPGALVVGHETYLLTRNSIRYETLNSVTAKGIPEPVEAWRAIGPLATGPERPRAPMVGREREIDLLGSIWDRAVTDRRPHLVTIVGPPGIGKSRLQREFSALVHGRGGSVARGRCLPYGDRVAYGAFIQLIRTAAGIYENDSKEEARAKLAATIGKLLPSAEAEKTTFYLSILMGLSAGEQSLQRGYLFFAARRFLETVASTQPLLVVLEDLHWADNALLDLVEYLAAHLKDIAVVIIGLARPEFIDQRPGWGSGLFAHSMIGLEPLSSVDAAVLAGSLLAQVEGSTETVHRLAETAEGNPLFIEELTAAVVEGQELSSGLPTTVRAAIASRLDALPNAVRDVLLDASVVGRTFWRGVLNTLSTHANLDDHLALLEARDFIRRVPTSRVEGDVEYQFRHILIHDVAYATLPRSTRRQHHRLVAEYIESVTSEAVTLASILAHHWREAGEPGKAIEYLMLSAEQALKGWALNDAVALFDSALSLAVDDEQRFRIRLARGLARSKLLDYPAAVADLGELLPNLAGHQRIEALLGYSWASEWTENTDETIASAEEALMLAQAAGDRELAPVARAMLSQGLAMRGGPGDLDSAGEVGEEALRTWSAGARPWERLNHEHMLGEQHYWVGRIADAHALMTSASRAGTDPQSIQTRLRSAALMAQILCSTGRYEESIQLFDETMRLGQDLGRPIRIVRNYSTQPLRELFHIEEARRRSEESLDGPDEAAGFAMPRANARTDLIFTALLAGDIGTAENFWRIQWDESSNTRAWTRWLVQCRLAAAKAEMELFMGQAEEAVDWARKTIELCLPVRRFKYEIAGRTVLGRGLVETRKAVEGVAELRLAVEQADRLGAPPLRWQAHGALARALYATGDDNGAERAFAAASSVIQDVATGLSAERSARFLGAEPIRGVLGGLPKARQ
jgi:class 3 adenylate cyclase/tetratricopeptide (TPR) repeat protein